MMLGLLLARAGINVIVLEKHADFFRDFRGDTIHPSTLDLIDQLGLREQFDAVPHNSLKTLDMVVNGLRLTPLNFGLLRGNDRLVIMPQWDFLSVLSTAAQQLPTFTLLMQAEAVALVRDGERATGVIAETADGRIEITADLTVAADGRDSTLRDDSGLRLIEFGVPVDVLWFRLPRPSTNSPDTLAYITPTTMFITIPRTDYYQTARLIPKGGFDAIRAAGLDEFREVLSASVPFLRPSAMAIASWDDVKLLTVQVNRLEQWSFPGFLCIGDAAHAMSPAFGVGINYAIQDAVAAANLLVGPLRRGSLTATDLERVQSRRAGPAKRMQDIQLRLHSVIGRPGGGRLLPSPVPAAIRGLLRLVIPPARFFTARLIGRGFRPERIRAEVLSVREPG
jgi:2-polyprenyl-6-methoxyphenol hydroxylase-like FAD-dependent oxidoreductase